MNILILTSCIGSSATGVVSENLICGLINNKANVKVITERNSGKEIPVQRITTIPMVRLIEKQSASYLSYLIFNYSLNEIKWINKAISTIGEFAVNRKFDFIMVIASAGDIHLIQTGRKASLQHNIPLYIHATDPIPSIKEWFKFKLIRSAIHIASKKSFKAASIISLTNPAMLAYQIQIDRLKKNEFTFVAMNPVRGSFVEKKPETESQYFLYLGALNQQRRPDIIIESFIEYAKINSKAILQFVGENEWIFDNYIVNTEFKSRIQFLPFTDNPDKYIEKASVLIDIDAPFANDVFISSKLNKYLNTNVPVLSITFENSPSENLLKSLPFSSLAVHYVKDDIINAFDTALYLGRDNKICIDQERKIYAKTLDYRFITKIILEKLELYKETHDLQ